MSHPARKVPVLAVTALCLLGLGAVPAVASPAAHQTPKVPWNKAGPGWAVVQYSTGTLSKSGSGYLYLTSPQGKKYRIFEWKKQPPVPEALVDWSGDRQRVLVSSQFDATAADNVEQISLVTGKVITKFSWPGNVFPIGYTKPDGLNILAIRQLGMQWQLQRYNLQGQLQKVLASGDYPDPDVIYSPDGVSLIAGTIPGLEEISNAGGVTARFTVPGKVELCDPVRWWNATTVLTECLMEPHVVTLGRLWLVNVKTGKVRPLSSAAKHASQAGAWQLTSGLYMQDENDTCEFIAQQYRDGSTHLVKVPGSNGDIVATGVGARLLVETQSDCGRVGTSLVWFNPKTKSVSDVLRTTGHTIGVQAVVAFGGEKAPR